MLNINQYKIAAISLSLLLGTNALASYDKTTTSVKVATPTRGISEVKTIVFPSIVASSVYEGMQEAKDYSSATSQRFIYKIKDLSAKVKGSFKFNGGSLMELANYLDTLELFTEIKQGNTLIISSKKYFSIPLKGSSAAIVKKELRKTPGVTNISIINGSAKFTSTKKQYRKAISIVAQGQQNKTSPAVLPKEQITINTKAPSIKGNGYGKNTVVVIRGGGIDLDKPYTVKTFLRKLGRETGKSYDVYADTNIPVDRTVRIKGVADLNKYLKKTTGVSISAKTTKSGLIIVE